MQKDENCIYCADGVGTTSDHVPPKAFFSKKIPNDSQLITVPCCEECRLNDQKNDQLVRNVFVSLLETEGTEYVKAHLLDRRDRSFQRKERARSDILELTSLVDAFTSDGKSLGEWPTLNLDDARFHRFFDRLARALIYHHYNEGYFKAEIGWVPKVEFPDEFYQVITGNYPCRRILGVLSYAVTREFEDGTRWILVEFYDSLPCLIRVTNLEHNQALDEISGSSAPRNSSV